MAISPELLSRKAIEEHYDVVVLGTQVPALVTAALCARLGLRVAVLGQSRHAPTYTLDNVEVPTSLPFLAAPCSELGRTLQRELSLSSAFSQSASLGACTPTRRIDLRGTPEQLRNEIAREFPCHEEMWTRWMRASQQAYAERLQSMQSPGRSRLASLTSWLRELKTNFDRPHLERTSQPPPPPMQSDELWRLATAIYRFFSCAHVSNLQTDEDWAIRGVSLYQLLQGSLVAPARFGNELLTRVQRSGGNVQLGWSATAIKRDANWFTLPLRQQDRVLRCAEIIVGCDADVLEPLFDDPPEALREWNGRPRTHLRFLLNIICRRASIPVVVPRQLIAYDHPDRADLHIVIRDISETKALLCAEHLFSLGRSNTSARIAHAREDILDHLFELFPDLEHGLIAVDSPHDGRSPSSFENSKINSSLDLWSRGPQYARRLVREGPAGARQPRPLRLGAGLWLAGDSSTLGLGFDGAAIVAREISRACEHHQPRRFRRSMMP